MSKQKVKREKEIRERKRTISEAKRRKGRRSHVIHLGRMYERPSEQKTGSIRSVSHSLSHSLSHLLINKSLSFKPHPITLFLSLSPITHLCGRVVQFKGFLGEKEKEIAEEEAAVRGCVVILKSKIEKNSIFCSLPHPSLSSLSHTHFSHLRLLITTEQSNRIKDVFHSLGDAAGWWPTLSLSYT